MEIHKDWKEAVENFENEGKIALVLGGIDRGKTYFIRWLINHLTKKGMKVAFIDGDVGQSSVGPPATIGMVLVNKPVEALERLTADGIYFTGSITPAKNLLPSVLGLKKMAAKAIEIADKIVIDTTGFIKYPEGVILKQAKIELLEPDCIFAFSSSDELTPVLSPFKYLPAFSIKKIAPHENVKSKSPEFRANNRKEKFLSYFSKKQTIKFDLGSIGFSGFKFTFKDHFILPKNELKWLSSKIDFPVDYAEKTDDAIIINMPSLCEIKNTADIKKRYSISNIARAEPFNHLVGLIDENNETSAIGIIKNFHPKSKIVEIITVADCNKDRIKRLKMGRYKLPEELFEEISP